MLGRSGTLTHVSGLFLSAVSGSLQRGINHGQYSDSGRPDTRSVHGQHTLLGLIHQPPPFSPHKRRYFQEEEPAAVPLITNTITAATGRPLVSYVSLGRGVTYYPA